MNQETKESALRRRMEQERQVVSYLIQTAAKHGWKLHAVDDGESYHQITKEEDAMEHIFSVDESTVSFRHPDHPKGCVAVIVLGNSGPEAIADCSICPGWDEVMDEVYGYCESLA